MSVANVPDELKSELEAQYESDDEDFLDEINQSPHDYCTELNTSCTCTCGPTSSVYC